MSKKVVDKNIESLKIFERKNKSFEKNICRKVKL